MHDPTKPTAMLPTPYGVSVPAYDHPSQPGEYIFDLHSTAICAGIYDPKERARFAAECAAGKSLVLSRLQEYGGSRVQPVALPRPQTPAYPDIPKNSEYEIPIETLIDSVMDVHRWCDRAEILVRILGANFEEHDAAFEPTLALGLQILITGALENLAETEIACLEAAAFYALSIHPEWFERAVTWLTPLADTWFKDWVASRPVFRRFAALCQFNSDLPLWIAGGAE